MKIDILCIEDGKMAELKDKILIVDDEIASRDELSTILKDEYEILEADTDESVMETLQDNEGRIALVIINLEMHNLDGKGLLDLLKGKGRFANPVVMIISDQSEEEKLNCLEKGAADFLRRPFNSRLVKHRIDSILRWKKVTISMDALKYDNLTGMDGRGKACSSHFCESVTP